MHRWVVITIGVSLAFCAAVLGSLAASDPTLGLLITGPSGNFLFSFPQGTPYMLVEFGGGGASLQILTGTTLYEDVCVIFSSGLFSGYQVTGVGLLDRGISFDAPGDFGNTFLAGETLASFSFTPESGTATERFEVADDGLGESYAYVQFVVPDAPGDLWIKVLNGELVLPEGEPELQLVSYEGPAGGGGAVGQTPTVVTVTIKNVGSVQFTGPLDFSIGLSYAANWIPEWCTIFSNASLGVVILEPGAVGTYDLTIPAVPITAVEALERRERF